MSEPVMENPPYPRTELVSGLLIDVLAVGIWWRASSFPSLPEGHPGPALFPLLIAGGLFVAGTVLAVRGFRAPSGPEAAGPGRAVDYGAVARLAAGLMLVGIFPPLHALLGFIPTTAFVAAGTALLLRVPWLTAVLTGTGAAIVVYWLFTGLLGVPL